MTRVPKHQAVTDVENDCAAAALFARIAALSPPTLPPGVAERIIREVPRLAQMPAHGGAAMPSPLRTGSLRAAPSMRVVTSPPARRTTAGHRPIAGWAALASGIAALVLILPTAFQAQPVAGARHAVHNAPPPRQIALARMAPVPIVAVKMGVARLARAHFAPAPLPAPPGPGPDSDNVASISQPASVQMAAAVPVAAPGPVASSRPVYGPVDTEAPALSTAGAHAGIGPGLTPGYAFTSGAAGMAPGASGAHPR